MWGYFHTKHHKNCPLSPSSASVHPCAGRAGINCHTRSYPRPWAVSHLSLHPFLPVTQPVTSATLTVTHRRYPRDRSHDVTWEHLAVWRIPRGQHSGYGVRTDPGPVWAWCQLDFLVRYNIGTILSVSADYNLLKTNLSDTEEAGGDRFNYPSQAPHCERRHSGGGEI